ncbi:MAG: DUF58 domain-containing protein [Bacteroidota bacterium]
MLAWIQSLYLTSRFFWVLTGLVSWFLLSFLLPGLLLIGQIALAIWIIFLFADGLMIYQRRAQLKGQRITPDRMSNGDPNRIEVFLSSTYPFPAQVEIIDELPVQFQNRDLRESLSMEPGGEASWAYELRPLTRGEYFFGALNLYLSGPIGLLQRRFTFDNDQMVPTYPSFAQMRRYQLLAISNRLTEGGVKQIRRLGHTTEFEQIKEYVKGDDYRTINWKASARSQRLMVNQYVDERAQQVYCLLDTSRVMKMPFEGMSLMDYAINASLVLSNIAINRKDKAGLITFAEKVHQCQPASSRPIQMNRIMELLYNQETDFLEASFEALYTFVKRKLSQRSLLLLFTNFESVSALRRQLPYLQALNRQHLMVVVFFENTELNTLLENAPRSLEEIYVKSIGEDLAFQKRLIAKELEQHGILSVLTPPAQLTVSTLNQYLAIKAKRIL